MMRVFGGADQKASCAGEVQNCFVLAGGSAAGRQIAELVVVWCGILRRGFLPQAGLDKNNREILAGSFLRVVSRTCKAHRERIDIFSSRTMQRLEMDSFPVRRFAIFGRREC